MARSFVKKKSLSKAAKIGLWIGGIVLTVVLIIVGLWLWGSYDLNKKAQEAGNQYPKDTRDTYLSSCNGGTDKGHEDFCSCTLEYFEKNYSYNQFKDLKNESSQNGKSYSQIISDATNACTSKIPK